ncbi:Pentatricopeptide repeat-containing protein [Actinidia chinensis var. chinensis]|uniref:Pentatricopeptide repeat-containing protein n=1 Tax=Actinidia chinensis var. chinensis TaxID=1590841 RepID=A0A2R6QV93_ACTCC|nr:Pentatricopeptide repeat-containing protein [Actinidia chinensis var. chinensis]
MDRLSDSKMPKQTNPPPNPRPSPHSLTTHLHHYLRSTFALTKIVAFSALSRNMDYAKKVFSPIPSPNILGIPSSEAVPSPKTPPQCEEIGCARKVFHQIPERNLVAWSTMISGYSEVGMVNEAFSLFREMQKAGVVPDEVTLVSVISACAASGALGVGRWVHAYKHLIDTDLELSTALVNMYAKCGCIEKAIEVFNAMLVKDTKTWSSMILGMTIHGLEEEALYAFSRMEEAKNRNVDKGEIAGSRLLGLEPDNAENYILLSSSQWEKMSCVRKQMKDKVIKAVPGCSSIETDGFVQEFMMGDSSHPAAKEIREVLRDISERVCGVGHEPWTSDVLHNVGDEEKESALSEHSDRLAMAYRLLKTKAPAAISVMKNLRVCVDCHEVTKIISKLYGRKIIVRDWVRFHKFVDESCSCKDFW